MHSILPYEIQYVCIFIEIYIIDNLRLNLSWIHLEILLFINRSNKLLHSFMNLVNIVLNLFSLQHWSLCASPTWITNQSRCSSEQYQRLYLVDLESEKRD